METDRVTRIVCFDTQGKMLSDDKATLESCKVKNEDFIHCAISAAPPKAVVSQVRVYCLEINPNLCVDVHGLIAIVSMCRWQRKAKRPSARTQTAADSTDCATASAAKKCKRCVFISTRSSRYTSAKPSASRASPVKIGYIAWKMSGWTHKAPSRNSVRHIDCLACCACVV